MMKTEVKMVEVIRPLKLIGSGVDSTYNNCVEFLTRTSRSGLDYKETHELFVCGSIIRKLYRGFIVGPNTRYQYDGDDRVVITMYHGDSALKTMLSIPITKEGVYELMRYIVTEI